MFTRLVNWLAGRRERQRAKILASPFPEEWLPIMQRAVPEFARMSAADQKMLRDCMQIFLAEKRFITCRGIDVTEEMKVIVASQACLLLVGLPHLDVFPGLHEIIVYPYDLRESTDAIGPDGTKYNIEKLRAGEAWRRGPVVLAWNSVAHSLYDPRDGYNVILHEFAHVIDMQEDHADGVPPLPTRAMHDRWVEVFFAEYKAFLAANRRGDRVFINQYGAQNPSEFFAVLTEHFYEQPLELRESHPELFQLFADFYGRDPAQWRQAEPTRWFKRGVRI